MGPRRRGSQIARLSTNSAAIVSERGLTTHADPRSDRENTKGWVEAIMKQNERKGGHRQTFATPFSKMALEF
jgi:hypothetical protein